MVFNSQGLGPRWQSAGCLDQLQLAAGDQVAEARAFDRTTVCIVAGLDIGRRHAQRERAREYQEERGAPSPSRKAMMLLRAPRHRAQHAHAQARVAHARTPPRTRESAARLTRPRDYVHRCCAASSSSPWRRRTNSTCPAAGRVTITPPRSDVPASLSIQNKLPRLHPQKHYDLRTMMTPTGRLQLHARTRRHLVNRT